jgi:hypothetical protein
MAMVAFLKSSDNILFFLDEERNLMTGQAIGISYLGLRNK